MSTILRRIGISYDVSVHPLFCRRTIREVLHVFGWHLLYLRLEKVKETIRSRICNSSRHVSSCGHGWTHSGVMKFARLVGFKSHFFKDQDWKTSQIDSSSGPLSQFTQRCFMLEQMERKMRMTKPSLQESAGKSLTCWQWENSLHQEQWCSRHHLSGDLLQWVSAASCGDFGSSQPEVELNAGADHKRHFSNTDVCSLGNIRNNTPHNSDAFTPLAGGPGSIKTESQLMCDQTFIGFWFHSQLEHASNCAANAQCTLCLHSLQDKRKCTAPAFC